MSFDLNQLAAADTADMAVTLNGEEIGWVWTFAGPGHPKSIDQGNRIARERLEEERLKEQAQVNGRKWKAPVLEADAVRLRNVNHVVERLIGWSAAPMNGKDYPFTPDNARALLLNRSYTALLAQALEFLGEDSSFTPRSGNGSSPTPSETSN